MSYKTIDLIVIGAMNHAVTPIYLEYLYRNHFRPKKIYLCSFLKPLCFSNRIERLAYIINKNVYKGIVKVTGESFPRLVSDLQLKFQKIFDFQVGLSLQNYDYNKYSDKIEIFKAWDFKDPKLQKLILNDRNSHFLYTDGGIVPKSLFDEGVKMLHVHPGIVPFVRGSDGFLWSLKTRAKLGYSCFYMNAGIDTGDLLYQEEFELHKFPEITPLLEENYLQVYRALLEGYDLHLRANVLTKVINSVAGDLSQLKGVPQNLKNGREYYSMHSRLIKKFMCEYLSA